MPVQKIQSGRVLNPGVTEFIGHFGQLFYDESVGELRISDGVTPGGRIITSASTSTSTVLLTNLDGGLAFSNYGGLDAIDAGGI